MRREENVPRGFPLASYVYHAEQGMTQAMGMSAGRSLRRQEMQAFHTHSHLQIIVHRM